MVESSLDRFSFPSYFSEASFLFIYTLQAIFLLQNWIRGTTLRGLLSCLVWRRNLGHRNRGRSTKCSAIQESKEPRKSRNVLFSLQKRPFHSQHPLLLQAFNAIVGLICARKQHIFFNYLNAHTSAHWKISCMPSCNRLYLSIGTIKYPFAISSNFLCLFVSIYNLLFSAPVPTKRKIPYKAKLAYRANLSQNWFNKN